MDKLKRVSINISEAHIEMLKKISINRDGIANVSAAIRYLAAKEVKRIK